MSTSKVIEAVNEIGETFEAHKKQADKRLDENGSLANILAQSRLMAALGR